MKWQRILITGVSFVCIGVWLILLQFIFNDNTPTDQMSQLSNGNNDEMLFDFYADEFGQNGDDTISRIETDSNDEFKQPDGESMITQTEEENDTSFSEKPIELDKGDIKERGIFPGDFLDIAPDRIISIDLVLERILGESS